MPDGTLQLLGFGTSAAPLDCSNFGPSSLDLMAVVADFDGSGAAVTFVPMVEIFSDAGELMAFGKGESVAAGDSATVTFAPFLEEEVTTAPSGNAFDVLVTSLSPDLWWKLTEQAGTVANDSSGNNNFGIVQPGFDAPTWLQTPLVGTDPAALFQYSTAAQIERTAFPALSGDFTAIIFWNRPVFSNPLLPPLKDLMGQGTFGGTGTGHPGWSLEREANNQGTGNNLVLFIGQGGGGGVTVVSSSTFSDGTAYMSAVTRRAGVWRLYTNGGVEPSTYTEGSYASDLGFWVGANPSHVPTNQAVLSNAIVWGSVALSGGTIAALAAAAGF